MNRLLIVGAGNFGREVMDWALAVPQEKRDWELEGFLDNRADVVESLDAPYGDQSGSHDRSPPLASTLT